MASILNVTELDFDQIKENLKTYLKNQDGFTDYDFDGAGLNILLDVFANNTHYSALNAHFALNEAFLDSAQIRGNVVTRAKSLGYTARSGLSPRATISLVVTAGEGTPPSTLTLPRGTKFTTQIDNDEFSFVSISEVIASKSTSADTYTFNNIIIVEGVLKKIEYSVNNIIPNQKFQIPDADIDTSTLSVKVKSNPSALTSDTFSTYESLASVTPASKTYWLQENANEYYEIYFGDSATGVRPKTGNVVTMEYVYGNTDAANGASNFTLSSTLLSGSSVVITNNSSAAGGLQKESLESIRFNAPLKFAAAGRAVSPDDYRAIIKASYANIAAISTWGGEDHSTPSFGFVYIAIKPLTTANLTDAEKLQVLDILKGLTVPTITPVMVDVTYTYIELDVNVKYNPNLTGKTNNDIVSAINKTILKYSEDKLNDFDGVFRHSQISSEIDNTDPSILSSSVRPRMFKLITLGSSDINVATSFVEPIYDDGDPADMVIESTSFLYNGETCFIGDVKKDGSPDVRTVVMYKVVNSENVILQVVGELTLSTGAITLNGFTADATTTLKIAVRPNSLDMAPKRDQLLSVDTNYVNITADIDKIATTGQGGALNYTTTPRLR